MPRHAPDSNFNLALQYAGEILANVAAAALEVAHDIANPTDRIIIPTLAAIAKVTYDATILIAAHAKPAANPSLADLNFVRQAIQNNPKLYYDALHRMQARVESLEAPVHAFMQASGPERAGMAAYMATSVFVPGKFLSAVETAGRAAKNMKTFGIPYEPPVFFDWIREPPAARIPTLTLSDIRNITVPESNGVYLYVLHRNLELTIAPKFPANPVYRPVERRPGVLRQDLEIHHQDLGRLESVLDAGEFLAPKGFVEHIVNDAGHYRSRGAHLPLVTEKAFERYGFVEARGTYAPRAEGAFHIDNCVWNPPLASHIPGWAGPAAGLVSLAGQALREPPQSAAPAADTSNRAAIAESIRYHEALVAEGLRYQETKKAQRQLAESQARQRAANDYAYRAAHQAILEKTRCFQLPFSPRSYSIERMFLAWRKGDEAISAFRLRYGHCPAWIANEIRSQASAHYSLLPFNSSYASNLGGFWSTLAAANLFDSYNAYNLAGYLYSPWETEGQIGGVASQVATIENMVDSPAASAKVLQLCFLEKDMPSSRDLIQQIQREIHVAYREHKTLPFFSLHFHHPNQPNHFSFLYPVLHPAFKNTQVAELMGFLDYWMKCYLNGGFFDAAFLRQWHKTRNCDEAYLRSNMQPFKEYCRKHAPDVDYRSLREVESLYGLKTEARDSPYKQPFKTAFRLIFFVRWERKGDVLIAHPDFRVEYSVELMPDYEQYIKSYREKNGTLPPEYQQTLDCYRLFADQIKENMPKLPFCWDLFRLMGIATAFCYLETTLEKMGKKPIVTVQEGPSHSPFPNALPPIPVDYYRNYDLSLTVADLLNPLLAKEESKGALNESMAALFSSHEKMVFPQAIAQQIETAIQHTLAEKLKPVLPPKESITVNQDEVASITKRSIGFLLGVANREAKSLHRVVNQKLLSLSWLTAAQKKEITPLALLPKLKKLEQARDTRYQTLKNRWERNPLLARKEVMDEIPEEERKMVEESFAHKEKVKEEQLELRKIQPILEERVKTYQKAIQDRHAHKAAELAQYSPQVKALNQAKIDAFIADIDKEIALIQAGIDSVNADLQKIAAALLPEAKMLSLNSKEHAIELLTAIHEGISAQNTQYISVSPEDAVFASTSEITKPGGFLRGDSFSPPLNSTGYTARPHNTPRDFLRDKALKKSSTFKYERYIQHLESFPAWLLSLEKVAQRDLARGHYTHRFIGFTHPDLTTQAGDRFHIVGGCGLDMPDLKSESIPHGKLFCQVLDQAVAETKEGEGTFHFNGESYFTYPVSVEEESYHPRLSSDQEIKQERTREIFEAVCKQEIPLQCLAPESLHTVMDTQGATLMHRAAALLPPEDFAPLLQQTPESLEWKDYQGNLLLHEAAQSGNLEALERILDRRPKLVDVPNTEGHTALMLAILHGQQEIMEALHHRGANFNVCLPNGIFPLYMAIQKQFSPMALWMLDHVQGLQIDLNHTQVTALHLAIRGEMSELALKLIAKGARCDVPRPLDGFTALHFAAAKGLLDVLTAILNTRISVDLLLESHKTPLHLAAEAGHLDAVTRLIDRGAHMDAKTLEGETPLMLAIRACEAEVAHFLAPYGVVNAVNAQGQTASLLALQYAMPVVADTLIARGERVDIKDHTQLNCLYFLVKNGDYRRVQQLLKQGVAFDATFGGQSLLAIAAQSHHFLIVYALQKKGIPYTSTTGVRLLEYAIMADEIGFVRKHFLEERDLKKLALLAIEHGARECLTFFLKKIDTALLDDPAYLIAAIASNDEKILALLLPYRKDIYQTLDAAGNSLLHIAVQHGAHHLLPVIAKLGCPFSAENRRKQTPFHLAIEQDDADFLTRLFKLAPEKEWPADLWNIPAQTLGEAIRAVLEKYKGKRSTPKPKQVQALEEKESKEEKEERPLSAREAAIVNEFKTAVEESDFEEALSVLEENPLLIRVFKAKQGASLFQLLFKHLPGSAGGPAMDLKNPSKNVGKLPALPAKEEKAEAAPEEHTSDKVFALLKKHGVDPATYLGPQNVLLTLIKADTDEAACYQFSILEKYFPKALPILAADKSDIAKGSMAERALLHNKENLFDALARIAPPEAGATVSSFSALHTAVLANKYHVVQRLLQYYPVDTLHASGQTPLMLAAAANNAPLMHLLLQRGARVDKVDSKGNTLLHYALNSASPAAALLLIPLLRQPNRADRRGVTPLMLAASKGFLPVLHFLCEAQHAIQAVDADGHNALHHAALSGQAKSIRLLVKQRFAIDQPEAPVDPEEERTCHKRTPLHLAALRRHEDAVLCLLALDADPAQEDKQGFALCEYAILGKSKKMQALVKLLPAYHDKKRDTFLLHAAVMADQVDVLSALRLDGVDLHAVNANGQTALHLAAIWNAGNAARLLLEGDVMRNGCDQYGATPLHYAAKQGDVRLINLLGEQGAHLDALTSQGESPLALACSGNHKGAVAALLQLGADFTQKDAKGMTLAQTALSQGHLAIALLFQAAGDTSLQASAFKPVANTEKQALKTALPLFAKYQAEKKGSRWMQFFQPAARDPAAQKAADARGLVV